MDKSVSAADANRRFSELLRTVKKGRSVIVTSHGRTVRRRPVKIALDTNILAYAEGAHGADMRDAALRLLERLPAQALVLPVQTLGEQCLPPTAESIRFLLTRGLPPRFRVVRHGETHGLDLVDLAVVDLKYMRGGQVERLERHVDLVHAGHAH